MSTTKQVASYGPFKSIFAQGVKTGDTIHLAGQVALDPDGKPTGGDLVAQTHEVYAQVKAALAELGATMADIIDETIFVTDVGELLENLEPWCGARSEAYGIATPEVSQTCVQVAALVMPELKIEIKCVARV